MEFDLANSIMQTCVQTPKQNHGNNPLPIQSVSYKGGVRFRAKG